jgi:ParB-like chromosome segregation protein Spo0J
LCCSHPISASIAWRNICVERSEPCRLAAVVREISDAQLLTIGAQENLQRQDLDPVEEAQIIAWHERMFFDKNQAEIGALLGKSADWVSVRSRIHKLPDILKERLRQRPRAIKQMLELGVLYNQQPQEAVELAHRVVNEHLTVEALRTIIANQVAGEPTAIREERRNRRAGATSVRNNTINRLASTERLIKEQLIEPPDADVMAQMHTQRDDSSKEQSSSEAPNLPDMYKVAEALRALAAHADELSADASMLEYLAMAEQALQTIQRAFIRRTLPSTVLSHSQAYRLLNAEFSDLVLLLRQQGAALAVLTPAQGKGHSLYLAMFRLPLSTRSGESMHQGDALLAATPERASAIVPTPPIDMLDWSRRTFKLPQREAAIIGGLLRDLKEIFYADPGIGREL